MTNQKGRSRSIFPFYNDRGECENRIEEFKNGFAADRLSCHRFRANAFRLLLHSFAYNLVNLFRLQLPRRLRSAQIETLRTQSVQDRCAHSRKQLVASAFTWPAAGLFNLSSKPRARFRLFLVRLDCSTTHSRKGPAELSQKTVRGVKERHDRPTLASPTGRDPYLASPVTNLRYDFSF